jgi:hypothetical protein
VHRRTRAATKFKTQGNNLPIVGVYMFEQPGTLVQARSITAIKELGRGFVAVT